jgi:AmiR/NasT family two-component response regulator
MMRAEISLEGKAMESLAGTSVVILEDEALIALDTEDQLRDAGFKVVGIFASCDAALERFGTHSARRNVRSSKTG